MSLVRRVYNRYRAGGAKALKKSLWRRLADQHPWLRHPTLHWAHLGVISTWLAQARPLRRPPVVILSLPRSGSSWVGNLLGRAPDAVYLREPLTRMLQSYSNPLTVVPLTNGEPLAPYRSAARLAFLGLPRWQVPGNIVGYPEAWAYADRRRRRLVMKEVNPYLAEWLIKAYQPRIVYLLRHPAAIALSYQRQGWLPAQDPWQAIGRHFGEASAAAWISLRDYPHVSFVSYDALCENPAGVFREMFDFSGLTWDVRVTDQLRQQTSSDDELPYGVHRVTQTMIRNWVGKVAPDDLAELRAGYLSHPTPWFQSEADW